MIGYYHTQFGSMFEFELVQIDHTVDKFGEDLRRGCTGFSTLVII